MIHFGIKKYNLLIPMVGIGQRFRDEGFVLPKQLIDVGHQQMIDWSMSCIKTEECNKIFVIRRDTVDNNNMDEILRSKFGNDILLLLLLKQKLKGLFHLVYWQKNILIMTCL